MKLFTTIDDVRGAVAAARREGRKVGLVPTMGALHAGHASLIDASVGDGLFTVVSVFVNPTQFAPNEDFAQYPRPLQDDIALADAHGADAVFAPSSEEMYDSDRATLINVSGLSEQLCGRTRPTHFAGVCTVVAKLFNIVQPDAAYFGQKDAQQATVLRKMVADLSFPVDVRICPIVRERDGLAMSSRNRYLSAAQRAQAPAIYRALRSAVCAVGDGATDAEALAAAIRQRLAAEAPDGEVDYIEIVDRRTLRPLRVVDRPALIAVAVRLGGARLIDNIEVDPDGRNA